MVTYATHLPLRQSSVSPHVDRSVHESPATGAAAHLPHTLSIGSAQNPLEHSAA